MQTFPRWIALPENRSAQAAAAAVVSAIRQGRPTRGLNPLFLHGPPGTGKSHLAGALVTAVTAAAPDRVAVRLAAGDLGSFASADEASKPERAAARAADLLVVDDLHQLPERARETVVQLLDRGLRRGQQWVLTATEGPAQLARWPARLTSRLASGLVVALELPSPASRRVVLAELAGQHGLNATAPLLDWLAERATGSFRELESAILRLEALARWQGTMPTLDVVQEQFRVEVDARRLTVERIAQRVGRYFRVDANQLQGSARTRGVLVPRQVGMYLARRLTGLSLQQIGAYFGGRDHSTVLHACRKVEAALASDGSLSGAVRQLRADLA